MSIFLHVCSSAISFRLSWNSSLLECRISKFALNFVTERRDFVVLMALMNFRFLAKSFICPHPCSAAIFLWLSFMRLYVSMQRYIYSSAAKGTVSTCNQLCDGIFSKDKRVIAFTKTWIDGILARGSWFTGINFAIFRVRRLLCFSISSLTAICNAFIVSLVNWRGRNISFPSLLMKEASVVIKHFSPVRFRKKTILF